MRSDDIKMAYKGLIKESALTVDGQMAYEWERDFSIMQWALKRVSEHLEVCKEKGHWAGSLYIAKEELLNRISKYSCPSLLKPEYKTKENCPLGDACKCDVPSNGA